MKKIIALLFVAILMVSAVGTGLAAACSHPSVRVVIVRPATCTQTGLQQRVCNACGKVLSSVTIGIKPHVPQTRTVDSTCTSEGYTLTTCKNCGKVLNRTTIAKKAHVGQTKTVPATCTVDGYQLTTCKNCGTTLNRVTIPKLGHAWNLVGQSHNVPQHRWNWRCGRCGKTVTTALNSTSPNPSPVRPAIY